MSDQTEGWAPPAFDAVAQAVGSLETDADVEGFPEEWESLFPGTVLVQFDAVQVLDIEDASSGWDLEREPGMAYAELYDGSGGPFSLHYILVGPVP